MTASDLARVYARRWRLANGCVLIARRGPGLKRFDAVKQAWVPCALELELQEPERRGGVLMGADHWARAFRDLRRAVRKDGLPIVRFEPGEERPRSLESLDEELRRLERIVVQLGRRVVELERAAVERTEPRSR